MKYVFFYMFFFVGTSAFCQIPIDILDAHRGMAKKLTHATRSYMCSVDRLIGTESQSLYSSLCLFMEYWSTSPDLDQINERDVDLIKMGVRMSINLLLQEEPNITIVKPWTLDNKGADYSLEFLIDNSIKCSISFVVSYYDFPIYFYTEVDKQ